MAQEDSTNVEQPIPEEKKEKKEKKPFKPVLKGVKLGTDLYPLVFTLLDPDFSGSELNTELVFNNKFYVNADLGFQNNSRRRTKSTDSVYTNQGSFWRVGLDYNFMHKAFSEQAIFVGARYANASFDHSTRFISSSTVWGDQEQSVAVDNLKASWVELNFGLKIKVVKNLHLSTILRAKILTSSPDETLLSVGEIPGFGINRNSAIGAISYRLSYMIPISKSSSSKPEKQKKPKKKQPEGVEKVLPTDEDGEEE